MKLVRLQPDDSLLVECQAMVNYKNVVNIAERACSAFSIKSIVLEFNDHLIQVNKYGIVSLPPELQTGEES